MEDIFKNIENSFKKRELKPFGGLKTSAVLLPLFNDNGCIKILITQRALKLDHQPGDFCFPGGRTENNETPEQTAIRETFEETGIKEKDITIIGRIDSIVSAFGIYIIPILAKIESSAINNIKISHYEVEKVIFVPLDFFIKTQPEEYEIKMERVFPNDFPFDKIFGGKNYQWGKQKNIQYFYDYKGNIIWGLTAKMIKNLCDILKA